MTEDATKEPPGLTLEELYSAETECRRCPLHGPATQVVPGQGSASAHLMLVGEQPGHEEDLQGLPFVGPAGRVLDQALQEAGIDRRRVFVTNAVKHFKFERRGKRRLHKRPNTYEIGRCRWWIDIERAIIKPKVVVALGATAARQERVDFVGSRRHLNAIRWNTPRCHHPSVLSTSNQGRGR